jgi:pimeloyl-ACP methyl ester carboxylesterase
MSAFAPTEGHLPSSAHRSVAAADGTRIAWYPHAREGREARLGILLTNGLSTTSNFWKHLAPALARDHRLAHWSYRGHAESEGARSGDYAIATHADDLARVTEAARGAGFFTQPPVHVAFSMGVTVLLELYRRRPDLVRAMVLIAGAADHPFASSRVFRVPGVRGAIRAGLRAASPVVPRLAPIARRVSASKAVFAIARATGAVGPDAPRDEVEHFFRSVGAMDLRAYWETLRSLMEARASDILSSVRVPVLVIAPERDVMTLRTDLELLGRAIPRAAWVLVPRTGHAMLLEAGDVVAEHVQAFLQRLE